MSTNLIAESFVISLPYVMGALFVFGAIARYLIHFTVKRHEWFAIEFEKRVNRFIEAEVPGKVKGVSFYAIAKRQLEKTYYEVFEVRDRLKRRKPDQIMSAGDRIFLIRQGCAWLVKDILKQLKFLKWNETNPKLLNITKATLQHNPCFNKVFGIFPMSGLNDLVSIFPGLFVVGGILGTFVGIAGGLNELGTMNLQDLENTKNVMDRFLQEIAFAMHTSIVGIIFSLLSHIFNTIYSPERSYVSLVDRLESSLDLLWYRSDNNDYPSDEAPFDEHRDPSDVLAADSVKSEITKSAVSARGA